MLRMTNRTAHKRKWDWRKHLTTEEWSVVRRADKAKRVWRFLNRNRGKIVNRAIHRAKYETQEKRNVSK